ncbi:PEP-CTERM sorting domain-containing protein [Marinobacteraceae bacterium S3BR75-40.1]
MKSLTKVTTTTLIGAALMLGSAAASANLIVNGSFENENVGNGDWMRFDAADVDGWEGSSIEIWDSYGSVDSYEGEQHAELNAHPYSGSAFGIYQEFSTVAGSTYDVFFAYRARSSNDESFKAFIDNGADYSWLMDDHTTGEWSVFQGSFIAQSSVSKLTFLTVNPETGTVGNFLDDVRVTAAVPEPGTLALLGLGLVGFGLSRRKAR